MKPIILRLNHSYQYRLCQQLLLLWLTRLTVFRFCRPIVNKHRLLYLQDGSANGIWFSPRCFRISKSFHRTYHTQNKSSLEIVSLFWSGKPKALTRSKPDYWISFPAASHCEITEISIVCGWSWQWVTWIRFLQLLKTSSKAIQRRMKKHIYISYTIMR